MEIMKEKKLKRGIVRLVHEDNGDVSVYLDKRKIAKHTGATYDNIKNEDWEQNAYIWFALDSITNPEYKQANQEWKEALRRFRS